MIRVARPIHSRDERPVPAPRSTTHRWLRNTERLADNVQTCRRQLRPHRIVMIGVATESFDVGVTAKYCSSQFRGVTGVVQDARVAVQGSDLAVLQTSS
jgi:hypothetical protein